MLLYILNAVMDSISPCLAIDNEVTESLVNLFNGELEAHSDMLQPNR